MTKTLDEIKSIAEDLTGEDIILLCEKWIEEQKRWENAQPGGYFMEHGWDMDELFCLQILEINPKERLCSVVDHSQFKKPISVTHQLPKYFPTQQEAAEYYSKNY
jgi:hypothetical protein